MKMLLNQKPKPKRIYNPLKEDFTVMWAGDENHPKPYTIHSKEIAVFEPHIADHIVKHLAQKIVLDRGIKTNYEAEFEAAKKLIEEIEL